MKKLIFVLLIAIQAQAQAQTFDFYCLPSWYSSGCSDQISVDDAKYAESILEEDYAEGYVIYKITIKTQTIGIEDVNLCGIEYRKLHSNGFTVLKIRYYPELINNYGKSPWGYVVVGGIYAYSTPESVFNYANNL